MEQTSSTKKSLTEQIVQQTLVKLEGIEEFDSDTLGKLEKLATNGNLKKAVEISKVIRPT